MAIAIAIQKGSEEVSAVKHVRILAGAIDRRAGSHAYNRELALRLAERGYRVSIVCFECEEGISQSCEVHELGRRRFNDVPFLWRFTSLLEHRDCKARFAKTPLSKPDIVVCTQHFLLKPHWQRFPQVPFIYLPHSHTVGDEVSSYRLPGMSRYVMTGLYQSLQRWGLRHANRTLRFSEHGRTVLERAYGDGIARFAVNPMGVDVPETVDVLETMVSKNHDRAVRLLSVGRLVSSKRIDLLLDMLSSMNSLSWQLDIVGDGPHKPELESLVCRYGLEDRVHFAGFQNDPTKFYQSADLFVFPSRLENSPLVLLEAMSAGVPCLAMHHDGKTLLNANSEVIEHGCNGFLAKSSDDFCMQLRDLIRNKELLATIGMAARQTVLRHHTWESHLGRYDKIFEEIINESLRNLESQDPSKSAVEITR